MTAVAYLNWGRWVANCPTCPNALALDPGQAVFSCGTGVGACGTVADVEWPSESTIEDVDAAYGGQPPQDQSWQPGEMIP